MAKPRNFEILRHFHYLWRSLKSCRSWVWDVVFLTVLFMLGIDFWIAMAKLIEKLQQQKTGGWVFR